MDSQTIAALAGALAYTLVATSSGAQTPGGPSAVGDVLSRAGVPPTPSTVMGLSQKDSMDAVQALEKTYPLPPEVLQVRDRQPDNVPEVMNKLGLKPVTAPRTDLRQRTSPATSDDVVNALAPAR